MLAMDFDMLEMDFDMLAPNMISIVVDTSLGSIDRFEQQRQGFAEALTAVVLERLEPLQAREHCLNNRYCISIRL